MRKIARVIYVTAFLPTGSGEAFIYPEIDELSRQGVEVLIVPRSVSSIGIGVHDASVRWKAKSKICGSLSLSVLSSFVSGVLVSPVEFCRVLLSVVRDRRPRILLKNLLVLPKAYWLASIVRANRADFIHAHWSATTATIAMIASKLTGVPYGVTGHRWDLVEGNLLQEKIRSAEFFRVIHAQGRDLVVSKTADEPLLLHMGVDIPRYSPKPSAGHVPLFMTAANLLPVKGIEHLIRASSQLKAAGIDHEMHIFGDGPLESSLRGLASGLDLHGVVHFRGRVANEELRRMMSSGGYAAAVLPSVDLGGGECEGIPVFLIEAMASGLSVISTRTGGIPELVDEESGWVVEAGDAKALAEAMAEAVRRPDEARRRAGNARQVVEQGFSVEQVVRRLVQVMSRQG